MFFSRRRLYQEKYKELAYRQAFVHFGIPGLAVIFSAAAHWHAYMMVPSSRAVGGQSSLPYRWLMLISGGHPGDSIHPDLRVDI